LEAAMPNPFATTSFDPTQLAPLPVVILDDSGYIANTSGNSWQATDLKAFFDAWLESDFAMAGYSDVVNDIDAQFPDATYYYAENSAIITPQSTTYFADHGIAGTRGSDVVIDASGDNIVSTGRGADLIMLGSGANAVSAGAGDDVVVTGAGADVVKLGSGNDWLFAGAGDDAVRGGRGDDTVLGHEGNDTLSGGKGADDLQGGADDDRLNGGQDADRLDGGTGNDTLTGGDGADVFVFARGSGSDVLRDFEDGLDRIEIDTASTGITGLAGLGLAQQGNHVLVDLGQGDDILVRNTQLADLGVADFDFV
jgi:Ca2+-binding RTX toxin-like protein